MGKVNRGEQLHGTVKLCDEKSHEKPWDPYLSHIFHIGRQVHQQIKGARPKLQIAALPTAKCKLGARRDYPYGTIIFHG